MLLVFAMKRLSQAIGVAGEILFEVARLRQEARERYPWIAEDA